MPRKPVNPLQVIQSYIDDLNGLTNRILSDSRLVSIAGPSDAHRNITSYQGDARLPLGLNPTGFLFFDQLVEVVEKARSQAVRVLSYTYIYSLSDNINDWVFRYEYDRTASEGVFGKPHAHVHLKASHKSGEASYEYGKIHFPTGRISVEQLIAHLVHEWGVEPKITRQAASDILRDSYGKYRALRTDLTTEPVLFP